jgi:hypothetical protein
METPRLRSRLAMAAAALLLLANVLVPLTFGDVYPFTSAPMFRDAPRQCGNYRVFGPDGRELSPSHWLLQRVYDGNPVGYGVGVRPPSVLEQHFGVVHDEAAVRRHVEERLAERSDQAPEYVEVVQEVIGPIDAQHVGVMRRERWRIARPKL